MDILLGIQTKEQVLLVASRALSRGVSVLKADDKKVTVLNEHTAMAFSGEPGDARSFAEFIKANVQLYGFRSEVELSTHAVASFVRNQLSTSLRTRKPYQVNVLIGGLDRKTQAPVLRWIDYLGANVQLPYAAHGYASYYILATLDRYWKEGLTQDEGLELVQRCVAELQARMPIDFKGVDVYAIDKDGVKPVELKPFEGHIPTTLPPDVGQTAQTAPATSTQA